MKRAGRNARSSGQAPKTTVGYEASLRLHIVPKLGRLKVRCITRAVVKDLLLTKLGDDAASFQGQRQPKAGKRKQARGTVKNLLLTLSSVMAQAVEDGRVAANPLQKLGKRLKLSTAQNKEKPKAVDRQLLGKLKTEKSERTVDVADPL